jgi:hypothetical protein
VKDCIAYTFAVGVGTVARGNRIVTPDAVPDAVVMFRILMYPPVAALLR